MKKLFTIIFFILFLFNNDIKSWCTGVSAYFTNETQYIMDVTVNPNEYCDSKSTQIPSGFDHYKVTADGKSNTRCALVGDNCDIDNIEISSKGLVGKVVLIPEPELDITELSRRNPNIEFRYNEENENEILVGFATSKKFYPRGTLTIPKKPEGETKRNEFYAECENPKKGIKLEVETSGPVGATWGSRERQCEKQVGPNFIYTGHTGKMSDIGGYYIACKRNNRVVRYPNPAGYASPQKGEEFCSNLKLFTGEPGWDYVESGKF